MSSKINYFKSIMKLKYLHFFILVVPVCDKQHQLVYGGGENKSVNISCKVKAYPEPHSFAWSFNSSTRQMDIAQTHSPSKLKGTSYIVYTPVSQNDFGSLLCWAENDAGPQVKPCVFQVMRM